MSLLGGWVLDVAVSDGRVTFRNRGGTEELVVADALLVAPDGDGERIVAIGAEAEASAGAGGGRLVRPFEAVAREPWAAQALVRYGSVRLPGLRLARPRIALAWDGWDRLAPRAREELLHALGALSNEVEVNGRRRVHRRWWRTMLRLGPAVDAAD